jgi:hypothetical protein
MALLPSTWKTAARFGAYNPIRYLTDLAAASVAHRTAGEPAPLRVLLVSDDTVYTSEQQFAPLRRLSREFRRRLGVVWNHALITSSGPRVLRPHAYDLILFKMGFKTPEAQALQHARWLAERKGRAKLVYFDGDDDLCIQWPGVLELVDLYVKKHVFADPSQYEKVFVGKTNLTDHVARTHGVSFADNIIPRSQAIDPRHAAKIFCAWNVGLDDKIVTLFEDAKAWPELPREHDVVCRASTPPENWMFHLRNPVTVKLGAIGNRARVLTPTQKVPQDQYYEEMRRSRMVVSPFGYGELCWRDFEAVICRSLLIKPDMSHLRTEPDLFRPLETYVPVRWDYADLEEKVLRYAKNEAERARIVDRAYAVLSDFYRSNMVVDRFEMMLAKVGLSK